MAVLRLSNDLHDRCVGIARAALPNEGCGLLGAMRTPLTTEDSIGVSSIRPVANSLASPKAFALDGAGMIAAEEAIDRADEVLIGIMHSHPTSVAVPSKRDIDDAAFYDPSSTYVHLIVSMQGFAPRIRAYRFVDGVSVELDVVRDINP